MCLKKNLRILYTESIKSSLLWLLQIMFAFAKISNLHQEPSLGFDLWHLTVL